MNALAQHVYRTRNNVNQELELNSHEVAKHQ